MKLPKVFCNPRASISKGQVLNRHQIWKELLNSHNTGYYFALSPALMTLKNWLMLSEMRKEHCWRNILFIYLKSEIKIFPSTCISNCCELRDMNNVKNYLPGKKKMSEIKRLHGNEEQLSNISTCRAFFCVSHQ